MSLLAIQIVCISNVPNCIQAVLNTTTRRLKDKLFTDNSMVWPPSVDELEKEPEPNLLLLKFLNFLRNPSQMDFTEPCQDPHIVAISSLLLSNITGNEPIKDTAISNHPWIDQKS